MTAGGRRLTGFLRPPPPRLLLAITLAILPIVKARQAVELPGEITLGGLFPVHEKGETSCGRTYNRGVQRLEAMLFAVDYINADPNLLPGVNLGVNILDTCSRDTYALNQSLNFVRSSPNSIDLTALECSNGLPPRLRKGIPGRVIGVVGGSYSSVSIQVANLLRLFRVPQVSPASTAKDLSDKKRFEFFARTVPPDTFQAIAMVDVVQKLNWTYVSTVHSEGTYGENGIEVFVRIASERDVCIATQIKVPGSADSNAFDEVIKKLNKGSARAVVLFTRAEDARGLLLAASRAKESAPFHWLASDGWGRQPHVVRDLEEVAEGAITIELYSKPIPQFDDYVRNLTPETNKRNPWFAEYWEETFNCSLSSPVLSASTSAGSSGAPPLRSPERCDESLRLGPETGTFQESKVPFVVDAVLAFGHALHKLQQDKCGGPGTCPSMLAYDGGAFYYDYLLNVSFEDPAGTPVKFTSDGDGLARYDILNFQRTDNISSSFEYRTVGRWFNSEVQIDTESLSWTGGARKVPTSACSEPCGVGMIKRHHKKGDICCWICDACKEYEYVLNESTCADCGHGWWPHLDKKSCFQLEVRYISYGSPAALGPNILAACGIAVTLATAGVFLRFNDTPLVRATGRELSYVLLGGILICLANTFILLHRPTMLMCTIQRFSVGLGFCTIYSALLTKTSRISRIFDSAQRSAMRPKFISPKSQVLITLGLVSVQAVGALLWLVLEPPGTRMHYPSRSEVWLRCRINDTSFLVSQSYNMVLICVCTVYAFKTRKIPENFNESKFIVFTMYTTCVIWLAFLPIYFTIRHALEVQVVTLCVSISLSAWVSLACLFAPKVYIILIHPEKNVRRLTMSSTTYRRRSGVRSTATGALSVAANDSLGAASAAGAVDLLVVSQSPGPNSTSTTNATEAVALL